MRGSRCENGDQLVAPGRPFPWWVRLRQSPTWTTGSVEHPPGKLLFAVRKKSKFLHTGDVFAFWIIEFCCHLPLDIKVNCDDCTNLHERYDPPILVFCKFRFPRNPWGERAFAHAGPALWNSLPQELKDSNSSTSFKCNLKTHLSNLAFWRQIFFLYGVHVYTIRTCHVCQ